MAVSRAIAALNTHPWSTRSRRSPQVPIETATYIHDFNSAYPVHGDSVGVGDSHVRLIKQVLQNTFPNLMAPVTATALQLNSNIPTGIIVDWYGSALAVPSGWGICNGSIYARSDGTGNITAPNLQDQVVVGAGNLYATGATGGSTLQSPGITCSPFSVLQANLPNVYFTVGDGGHTHVVSDPGHFHTYNQAYVSSSTNPGSGGATISGLGQTGTNSGTKTTGITNNTATTGITVNSGGSGTAITVSATCATFSVLQPYMALYKIMKL